MPRSSGGSGRALEQSNISIEQNAYNKFTKRYFDVTKTGKHGYSAAAIDSSGRKARQTDRLAEINSQIAENSFLRSTPGAEVWTPYEFFRTSIFCSNRSRFTTRRYLTWGRPSRQQRSSTRNARFSFGSFASKIASILSWKRETGLAEPGVGNRTRMGVLLPTLQGRSRTLFDFRHLVQQAQSLVFKRE